MLYSPTIDHSDLLGHLASCSRSPAFSSQLSDTRSWGSPCPSATIHAGKPFKPSVSLQQHLLAAVPHTPRTLPNNGLLHQQLTATKGLASFATPQQSKSMPNPSLIDTSLFSSGTSSPSHSSSSPDTDHIFAPTTPSPSPPSFVPPSPATPPSSHHPWAPSPSRTSTHRPTSPINIPQPAWAFRSNTSPPWLQGRAGKQPTPSARTNLRRLQVFPSGLPPMPDTNLQSNQRASLNPARHVFPPRNHAALQQAAYPTRCTSGSSSSRLKHPSAVSTDAQQVRTAVPAQPASGISMLGGPSTLAAAAQLPRPASTTAAPQWDEELYEEDVVFGWDSYSSDADSVDSDDIGSVNMCTDGHGTDGHGTDGEGGSQGVGQGNTVVTGWSGFVPALQQQQAVRNPDAAVRPLEHSAQPQQAVRNPGAAVRPSEHSAAHLVLEPLPKPHALPVFPSPELLYGLSAGDFMDNVPPSAFPPSAIPSSTSPDLPASLQSAPGSSLLFPSSLLSLYAGHEGNLGALATMSALQRHIASSASFAASTGTKSPDEGCRHQGDCKQVCQVCHMSVCELAHMGLAVLQPCLTCKGEDSLCCSKCLNIWLRTRHTKAARSTSHSAGHSTGSHSNSTGGNGSSGNGAGHADGYSPGTGDGTVNSGIPQQQQQLLYGCVLCRTPYSDSVLRQVAWGREIIRGRKRRRGRSQQSGSGSGGRAGHGHAHGTGSGTGTGTGTGSGTGTGFSVAREAVDMGGFQGLETPLRVLPQVPEE